MLPTNWCQRCEGFLTYAERDGLIVIYRSEKFTDSRPRASTRLGIPVKVNADSGGKPNGVPGRR